MFWELAPGDVIGKPVKLQCPKIVNAWKRRKHEMEKASRRLWIEFEHSPRAMQLREYTLKEFWEIFVDDRPFGADAFYRQVNVQSKAVFSFSMTLMDKIRGWEDEEKMGRIQICSLHVDFHKRGFDRRTNTRPGTRRVPEETHDVHYALHKLGLCWYFR